MFNKIKLFIDLFRKGSEVANAEAWKNHQITGTLVGGLILAIINVAQIYGFSLPVDVDSANAIGAGLVAAINVLLTAATSANIGLLPAVESKGEPEQIRVESDSGGGSGLQETHPGISDDTREKAMQYVNQTKNELFGNLDTTYSNR